MNFDQIKEIITPYPNLHSPSFIQGMLIGVLCGDNDVQGAVWIKKLIEDGNVKLAKDSFLKGLHQLYLETYKGFNSSDSDSDSELELELELELCLPEGGAPIIYQAMMIALSCAGILYGLALIGCLQDAENEFELDIAEMVNNLRDIACMSTEGFGDSITEEKVEACHLITLVKLVKINTLFMKQALRPVKRAPISAPDSLLYALLDSYDHDPNTTY